MGAKVPFGVPPLYSTFRGNTRLNRYLHTLVGVPETLIIFTQPSSARDRLSTGLIDPI